MNSPTQPLDPICIWTDGRLGQRGTKTATGLLTLGTRWTVACVVDSANVGLDAGTVIGTEELHIPVVASLGEASQLGARSVVIGVNAMNADTEVPPRLKAFVEEAISCGLNVISGSHAHLNDDADLASLAGDAGVQLVDIRVEGPRINWSADVRPNATVMMTVGTDSAVGKMTTALLMHRAALTAGIRSGFLATGQIAAMCGADALVCADHTLGDFQIGAIQHAIFRLAEAGNELVVVEGQGAILHRAYGGGIINILFGTAPDTIVMCHDTDRSERAMFPGIEVSSPADELDVISDLARRMGIPAKLAGFSVFGQKPFNAGFEHDLPTVNIRHPGGAEILLESALQLGGHFARFPRKP